MEDGLAGAILEPTGITRENHREILDNAFLVKVQGSAEIDDYKRLNYASGKFLDIVGATAYMTGSGAIKEAKVDLQAQIYELEQQVKSSTGVKRADTNTKLKEAQRNLKELEDPIKVKQRLVDSMGIGIEAEDMDNIVKVLSFFNPDNFEVTIIPDQGTEKVVFRGILDKELLRIQPDYLRALYAGAVEKSGLWSGK